MLEKIYQTLTNKILLYPFLISTIWIFYVLKFWKNSSLGLETRFLPTFAFVIGLYFLVIGILYVFKTSNKTQKSYYKTLPEIFHIGFVLVILLGIYKFGFTQYLVFWIVIFGGIIYMIDSRYYALIALWCLGSLYVYIGINNNLLAESYGIYTFYFLLLCIIIGIFESKYLENFEQKK